MDEARRQSSQDRAVTHSFSKYALALIAVCSFGFGVLVRDVAQDYRDAKTAQVLAQCKADAEHYASLVASVLNGGGLVEGSTSVNCRVRRVKS